MRVVGLTFLVLFVGIFNSCSKESKNNIGGARVVEQSDPPKIIDVQLRENGRESSIELLVSFDEVVIVRSTEGPTAQTTDQTPRISFFFKSDLEQTLRFAKYHSGSGSNMLIFRYRYESQEGIDIRDIQVSSEIDLNGGKIADYEEKKEATLVLKSPQDSTIPSPPSLRLISPSSSTSSNPAPRFIVSQVEEESRVRLYSDDTCTVSISEEVVVSEGETSVEVTSSILDSDRTITYYARQTDSNGNTSSCSSSSVSYTYDTTAPDMPFSLVLKNPISSISNIDTPEITVSGLISGLEPGAVVRLYRDSGCQNEISSPEQVGLGQISVDIVSNRLTRDDTYTYYANQTDEAGNVSSCSIAFASYTYDSTAPSVPNRLVLYNTPTSGNNPSPEITVFGIEENATIQLFRDGRCQSEMSSIVRSKKGQTSIRIKSAHLSHNGNYIYFARQTDEAGNVSNCSFASIIYIFDNTPSECSHSTFFKQSELKSGQ